MNEKNMQCICTLVRAITAFGYHWEYVKQGGDEKI